MQAKYVQCYPDSADFVKWRQQTWYFPNEAALADILGQQSVCDDFCVLQKSAI